MTTAHRRPPPIPRDPWHAIIRAKERYGLTVEPPHLRDIAQRIEVARPENVRPITACANGSVAVLVWWRRQWVLVAFRPDERRVVTFLPLSTEFSEDGRIIRRHIREASNG